MLSIVNGKFMSDKDDIRYQAGDRLTKNVFICFNDVSKLEDIENRVIILDQLFSTNIRRFSGDLGLKCICDILLSKKDYLSFNVLKDKSVDDISDIVDGVIKDYHSKGYPRCSSFITKYLFWSVYALASEPNDYKNFFIYDRLVAKKIKFSFDTRNTGFYKKWYKQMQQIKERNGALDNRKMDLDLWSEQKNIEKYRKKYKNVPN